MALFQRYNNENVLIRAVIAGLLDVLNNHIQYNQIWGNDPIEDIEKISVPWFYNQSGDQRFMQGYTVYDDKDNPVRIIDYIRGPTLFNYIFELDKEHESYFHEDMPVILKNLIPCFEAIQLLHDNDTCHGDIRNDHIIIETGTGLYRWIDFDLNQNVADFDIWSIGNIINYVVGKGITSFHGVFKGGRFPDNVKNSLTSEDASAFYEYRIMNLIKLYPYIPDSMSKILLHFTTRPTAYYALLANLIDDFKEMIEKDFSRL